MHARWLANGSRGLSNLLNRSQGGHRKVHIGCNEVIVGSMQRIVHPREHAGPINANAGIAQCERLAGLRHAEPRGAAGERSQSGGDQTVPIRIGLHHSHHLGGTALAIGDIDQVAHVVSQRGEIDDHLRRVFTQRLIIVALALFGGKLPFFKCTHAHAHHCGLFV